MNLFSFLLYHIYICVFYYIYTYIVIYIYTYNTYNIHIICIYIYKYPLPPTNSSQLQVTLEHEGIRSHRHSGQHRSWRRHGGIRRAAARGRNEGDASQEAQGLRGNGKPPGGWRFGVGGLFFGGDWNLQKKQLQYNGGWKSSFHFLSNFL